MARGDAAGLDDLQILTVAKVRGKLEVTEYVDLSTGEILSATEAKSRGVVVVRGVAREMRRKKLDALRSEVKPFALFVLSFKNRRGGLQVPLTQIVKWYAMLHGKQPKHVNRYVQRLVEGGILESPTVVHQDFMIFDRSIPVGDLKGEEFSAYVRFWDKLLEVRTRTERSETEVG